MGLILQQVVSTWLMTHDRLIVGLDFKNVIYEKN